MKYANKDEQMKLTEAVEKVTKTRESIRKERQEFTAIVQETVRRIGTVNSEYPAEDNVTLSVDEDTAPGGSILFRSMRWVPENGGETVVTGLLVSDLKTEVEVPLDEVNNPEILYEVL